MGYPAASNKRFKKNAFMLIIGKYTDNLYPDCSFPLKVKDLSRLDMRLLEHLFILKCGKVTHFIDDFMKDCETKLALA